MSNFKKINMLLEELESLLWESGHGICRACHQEVCSGVEPDARNYPCESCGELEVYGVEELMMMGEIETGS